VEHLADQQGFELLVLTPVLAMLPICAGLYALGGRGRDTAA
jgi:hypothetical protein